jgi:hypothetical protein
MLFGDTSELTVRIMWSNYTHSVHNMQIFWMLNQVVNTLTTTDWRIRHAEFFITFCTLDPLFLLLSDEFEPNNN